MSRKWQNSKWQLAQDDIWVIFVCGLILFGIIFVWYWQYPLWFAIPLTAILLLSMYYQVMVWIKQTSMAMIGMEIEDRMMNEMEYQTKKRGYTFEMESYRKDSNDMNSDYINEIHTNIPKGKKAWIKFISLIIVIITPAWNYRDV